MNFKKFISWLIFLLIFSATQSCAIKTPTTKDENNNNDQETTKKSETNGLQIYGPLSIIQSGWDSYAWIYGKVKNNDKITHVFVKVSCAFLDSSGNIVGADWTYIDGSVKKLVSIDTNTNTVLEPGETGLFAIATDYSKSDFDSVKCNVTSDDTQVVDPDAKLELVGDISVTDGEGYVTFSGTLKNSGMSPLVFGEIYIYPLNDKGQPIRWDDTFVKGKTVYLSSIDRDTDTALYPGDTGPFETDSYGISYSQIRSVAYRLDWDDATIENGTVTSAPEVEFSPTAYPENNIDKLRFYKKLKDERTRELEEMIK